MNYSYGQNGEIKAHPPISNPSRRGHQLYIYIVHLLFINYTVRITPLYLLMALLDVVHELICVYIACVLGE